MIERDLFHKIVPWLDEEKIIVINGARQVGKTTLLYALKQHLEKRGEKTAYFAADQELGNPIFQDAKLFLRFAEEQYLASGEKRVYIFLDEFQYISAAGLFLKQICDRERRRIHLVVSGSSSLEIAKNSEFLTGRKISFHLSSFSFREYLRARSKMRYDFSWKQDSDISALEEFYRIYGEDLKRHFLDYVAWGGYPETATTEDPQKREAILKDIVSTYIQKDVAGFLRVENISAFNKLVALLGRGVGNLVNKTELANTLDLNIKTIDKYLDMLEGTYVFSLLRPFHSNIRKTLTKTPKVYVHDFGVLKCVLRDTEVIRAPELLEGNRVENFVFNEISRARDSADLFFYRTASGAEVDFVVRTAPTILIEVKWRAARQKTPSVMRALKEELGSDTALLVTTRDELRLDAEGTLFVPASVLPFVMMVKK
ncbi:MAG: ATP-binding protein [Patescibacteria group bacterium]